MSLSVPLNIKLHATQQIVHSSAKKHNCVRAGKRFGKTKLALYRCLQKAGSTPNGTVWYLAPTFRMAKQIAWRELLLMLPPQMIRRKIETDLFLELYNGCVLQLIGCDNEDSLRGVKLHHYCMDEAAYVKEYVKPLLDGQLLGNVESGSSDIISSPNRTGKNWFTSHFEETEKKAKSGDPEYAAWHFTIYDNPTIPLADIEKLKANTPDDTWDLEYLAKESSFAGTKYHEYSYERHTSTYSDPSENLPTYRAIDWGLTHPTVCLWAKVDRANGMVYITDEFYKSGLIIEEVCRVIKEKSGSTPITSTIIDPSANRRDQITGRSVKDEFLRCGIGCVDGDRRGADNIGGRGTDITKMFFLKNMVRINPRCKNLILELRNVQWGQKEGDDATDALRYLLVRLHDLVFNGVLINHDQPEPELVPKHTFNLNDTILFPKREQENLSNIRAELNAY